MVGATFLAHPAEDQVHSRQNEQTQLQAEIDEINNAMLEQKADREEVRNLREELNTLKAKLHSSTDDDRRVYARPPSSALLCAAGSAAD